jgi:hypothetical protein
VRDEDAIELPEDDFRRARRYLAPWVFALPGGEEGKIYPPPWDLIDREHWNNVMDLPTDVALKSSSYEGSQISRLDQLHSDWIFSWPDVGDAPFMDEAVLLAGEEFDALVFSALHGWYRQAIGCLRNAFETLMIAAALAATNNKKSFEQWRAGAMEYGFGTARVLLKDSMLGKQVDVDANPESVFGDLGTSWTKDRYARLCSYTHSHAGYNNADFWESTGPVFRPAALAVVEAEFRETLALCYLLVRLAWPTYRSGPGQPALLDASQGAWMRFDGLLRKWLLPDHPHLPDSDGDSHNTS